MNEHKPNRDLQDAMTLQMLVWNLPVGVYITSASGDILDANPGCLEIFGVSSLDELRSYSTKDLYEDPAQRQRELDLLEENGYVNEFELRLRRPDTDEIRTVLDTCYTADSLENELETFHGILVDISDRKALEAKIEELEQAIQDGQ